MLSSFTAHVVFREANVPPSTVSNNAATGCRTGRSRMLSKGDDQFTVFETINQPIAVFNASNYSFSQLTAMQEISITRRASVVRGL